MASDPIVADAVVGIIGKTMALVNPAKLDSLRKALSSIGIEQTEGLDLAKPGVAISVSPPAPGLDGRHSAQTVEDRTRGVEFAAVPMKEAIVFVEAAYAEKKFIDVKVRTQTGGMAAVTLRPTALYQQKGKLIFDGVCFDCGKIHTVTIEDVVAVGRLNESSRRKK
jgi:hypothetical protein